MPVDVEPSDKVDGLRVRSVNAGGLTVRFAEAVLLPTEAEILIESVVETGTVLTVNFAEVAPLGTVTPLEVDAAALDEARATTTPLEPALAESVTVPLEATPPTTDAGDNETLLTVWAEANAVTPIQSVAANPIRMGRRKC